MCEPWQDLPQDHPKGLVQGTGIAICSDKDTFYLPFFTQTQLKIIPPLLEWQEWKEFTALPRKKKMTVKKRNDIEYKEVKCFAMGFAAVHFNQFLANLVRVWFG